MAGFSFNLKTNYEPAPLALEMIRRVLAWNNRTPLDDEDAQISRVMLEFVRDGRTENDFRKWVWSSEAVGAIACLDREWAELLFNSVALATYAHDRRATNLAVAEDMPHWSYSCMTQSCAAHRTLDGFVARYDDLVWNAIYPPNGWACGCFVLAVSPEDGEEGVLSIRTIDAEMLQKCVSWIDEKPAV